jgi:dihydroorotase
VQFVSGARQGIAATITAHHLRIDRNAMFDGGIRPHAYCLPLAKRARHKVALRRAATSGSERFFLGTDSAPHARGDKESSCGCAGIYSAPVALESYATTFEEEGALEHLELFASLAGPRFYGMEANEATVVLERTEWTVPEELAAGSERVVPFHAGEVLRWRLRTATQVI